MADTIDLPQFIAEVIAEVQPAADAKGVHVAAIDLAAMPRWVDADEGALRRLLHNALEAVVTSASADTVTVRLEADDARPDRWTWTIHWPGEADAAIQAIRCTFVTTLTPAPSLDAVHPMDILVVAESAQLRSMVLSYLHGSPHHVREATSAAEAVSQLTGAPCDVVVIDSRLPDTTVPEAVRLLRAAEDTQGRAQSCVIVLTAPGSAAEAEAAQTAGATHCVEKPLSRSTFTRILATLPAPPAPSAPSAPHLPSHLVAIARHQLTTALMAAPATQTERLRLLGQLLATTASEAGLTDIAHLAAALERAAETGDVRRTQISARTLLAWISKA